MTANHSPGTDSELLNDLTDADLVTRVAEGSAEALEVLYERYSRVVLSFAFRILGDRASAEELLQEVFLRTWRQASNFSQLKGSFVTWLLSITHNMAIDEIRKRNRRPKRAESEDPLLMLANMRDTDTPVADRAVLSTLRTEIVAALEKLPVAQRTAIELAYFQGLTQREIAEQVGEPLGTIKTRMRLGMRKLRDLLSDYGVELV
ncbi:MAG: sigma-70 family RNA polymerase sigma factor [Thermomicrobiales bacterium]